MKKTILILLFAATAPAFAQTPAGKTATTSQAAPPAAESQTDVSGANAVLDAETAPVEGTLETKSSATATASKNEVIENQTLQALSGALNKWSLYSSFTYRGGSIKDPLNAERPNILNAEESVGLADMSGNAGIKYRVTESDNISVQVGVYSTTPFHSTIETTDPRNKRDFDERHQQVNADDPLISYFKTYNIGEFPNVSFIKYQYATRGIYRDTGLRSGIALSQATAYKLTKAAYIAASLTYENYQYDKETTMYRGTQVSLLPFQTEHKLRGNFSTEFYVRRNLSVRLITDVFSLYRMKNSAGTEDRDLQQTFAMTYFFNRDISISPNVHFLVEDLRPERTNVGLNLNLNI